MRPFLLAGAFCAALTTGAVAQAVAPAPASPAGTGVAVPGDNSFTETQVRDRLEANGYSDIAELRKGEDGIWHASATHTGQHYQIALDYRGNIARN